LSLYHLPYKTKDLTFKSKIYTIPKKKKKSITVVRENMGEISMNRGQLEISIKTLKGALINVWISNSH